MSHITIFIYGLDYLHHDIPTEYNLVEADLSARGYQKFSIPASDFHEQIDIFKIPGDNSKDVTYAYCDKEGLVHKITYSTLY